MIDRRDLLFLLGAAALAPRMAFAQTKQPVLIGWLNLGSREPSAHLAIAFKEGLAALGLKESSRIVIEERWADGRYERLAALAGDLAAKGPAVIVAAPLPSAIAAAKAAAGTPVVIATGGDPVAGGVVASLARPGGMITGLTSYRTDLAEKYLELLLAAAPKLKRVGFLLDSKGTSYRLEMEAARRAIARYPLEASFAEAASPEEIGPAISRLATEGAQALVALSGGVLVTERRRMLGLAFKQRWPVVGGIRELAEEGALLAYGADAAANYRRAAWYVDRILKGAKPGDLPIEQPTKFELVINRKTADALGIKLSNELLFRADRVIE